MINFNTFTTEELFYHLIDLHQIPYEDEYDKNKYSRSDLLRWCNEIYENSEIK